MASRHFLKSLAPSIFAAACTGNEANVRSILSDRTSQVDVRDYQGKTALQYASYCGQPQVVSFLLQSGANTAARDAQGMYSIHYASAAGATKVVEKLLKDKESINAKANSGATPLHCAVFYNHGKVVELLITSGAETRTKNAKGETPLHFAVSQKTCGLDIIKRIVEASPEALTDKDSKGNTVLHIATRADSADKVETILELKRDLAQSVNDKGETALHLLAKRNQGYRRQNETKIAALLVQKCPEILKIKDSDGNTACDLAQKAGKTKFLEQLRSLM